MRHFILLFVRREIPMYDSKVPLKVSMNITLRNSSLWSLIGCIIRASF